MRKNCWVEEELTTKEILRRGVVLKRKITKHTPKSRDPKWFIPLISRELQFESKGSPIDPNTVGVILGDGNIDKCSGATSVTSHIDDVAELKSYIPYTLSDNYHDKRRYSTVTFRIKQQGQLIKKFLGTNTTWTKFIPQE
jgi:hypothetical protein